MYSLYNKVKINTLTLSEAALANSAAFETLLSEQSASGSQGVVESHSSHGGFNIPLLAFGNKSSGSTTSQIVDTRSHAVSGTLLQGAEEEAEKNITVTYQQEFDSPLNESITAEIHRFVLSATQPIVAQFSPMANGDYTLATEGLLSVVLDREAVNQLLQTSGASDSKVNNEQSGSYAGASSSGKQAAEFSAKREIKWA
jgi:hypothetical protein